MPTTQAVATLRYAFTDDPVLKEGATRYTPPMPAWAAETFIMAGLALALLGVAGTILGLITIAGRGVTHPVEFVIFIGMAFLGGMAIWHGARRQDRDRAIPRSDRLNSSSS